MMPSSSHCDDPEARELFTDLYNRYHRQMYGYALSMMKDPQDAEDVVQQVFLRLWSFRDNVRKVNPAKLRSYLNITVRNSCIVLLKSAGRISTVSIDEYPELEPSDDDSPDKIIIRKFDCRVLLKAFDGMNERYRQIILDKAVLHLDDAQAAEHIGIKRSYVRECLFRARASLKKSYLSLLEKSESHK